MFLKISLKQMGRTKARTITFLLLLTLAVTFLSLGINLWQSCNRNLEEYEKVFTTIGMVNQKENTVKVTKLWNAAYKEYTYWDEPVYDSILPVSLLDFEGANYIVPPERRPYFGAYCPNMKIYSADDEETYFANVGSIVEFIPYEDCIPTEPVKVKIVRSLWGYRKEGENVWFCDQFNDNPGVLKAGKTYITLITSIYNPFSDSRYKSLPYTVPYIPTISTQINKSGEAIAPEYKSKENWEEVNSEFYESAEGRRWEEEVKAIDRFRRYTIPVIPADKTDLLTEFHQKMATISKGRDITEEEYRTGAMVCIIPQRLAVRNELKLGDKINLQLYFANYMDSTSLNFGYMGGIDFTFLNSKGEAYPIFEDNEYEIVGIYSGNSQTIKPTGYEIGNNVVIIPAKSVKNSDEYNIVDYGPMKGYTTYFQIPNGTTKAYAEKFEALKINNLEITFYDGGYEELASGMRNLKMVSMILVLASGITTFAILIFFVYLFIGKQKKRTAIERSLGMTKKHCTESMLHGILIVTSVTAVIGSIAGLLINRFILSIASKFDQELYNTAFSNWVNSANKLTKVNATDGATSLLTSVLLAIIVILISLGIALLFIKNNLKAEPLKLLSKNED
ncbi:MAG: FtsX-like permease family protein [Herbinix sp.]|jgi:hypothetical protein|nr:FtsX-like permease family protein [Herbinix sp.]